MDFVPYLLLYTVAILLASVVFVARQSGRPGRAVVAIATGLLVASLTQFAGLRSLHVGVDSGMFARLFLRLPTESLADALERNPQESGFTLLMFVLRRLTDDPRWLFVTMSILTVTLCVVTMARHSRHLPVSVAAYVGLGSFLFALNGMRQGLAVAMCFAGWSVMSKHRWTGTLMFLLAATFHVTALAAFAGVLATRRARNPNSYVALTIAGTVAVALGGGALDLGWTRVFNERFEDYFIAGQQSGVGTLIMLIIFSIAAVATRDWARSAEPTLAHAWRLMAVAPFFMAFGLHIVPMGRLELYFSIFSTLVLAGYVASRRSRAVTAFALGGVAIYGSVYLWFWGGLLPYGAELSGSGWIFITIGLTSLVGGVVSSRIGLEDGDGPVSENSDGPADRRPNSRRELCSPGASDRSGLPLEG